MDSPEPNCYLPRFGVCAETTYKLQISRHVFDPRKLHKFNERGIPCFLVSDKGLALGQLLAAKESACRNAVHANGIL
jgi:hypothetical protein